MPCIRRSQPADGPPLVALWERSVRATHRFLSEADIAYYRPRVAEILAGESLELWVLTGSADVPIGFLGLSAHGIEALFLEPAHRRPTRARQSCDGVRCGPGNIRAASGDTVR